MYRYEITENSFHGGQHIAYAATLETAARSANRHDACSRGDCCCGGPQIRRASGEALTAREEDALLDIRYAMFCGRIRKH